MFFHLVLAAQEFPNDNPSLSDPCGILLFAYAAPPLLELSPAPVLLPVPLPLPAPVPAPLPEAPPPAPVALAEPSVPEPLAALSDHDTDAEIEVVEQFDPVEFELVDPAPPSAEVLSEPFALFVRTLVEVAEEAGCLKAAALLPAMLEGGHVEDGALSEATVDALVLSGVLVRSPSGIVGGEAFRVTAAAWRAILRGDSEDFSACGSRMLDEWSADLVARLIAAPARTEQLRRELRTRGVAAFGLVAA